MTAPVSGLPPEQHDKLLSAQSWWTQEEWDAIPWNHAPPCAGGAHFLVEKTIQTAFDSGEPDVRTAFCLVCGWESQ